MAVIYGSSTSGEASSSTTITVSHTVAAGDGRMMVVQYATNGTSSSPTGATYNGVAMTSAFVDTDPSGTRIKGIFYLAAPATGTHDMVITWSGAVTNIAASVSSMSGASPTIGNVGDTAATISTNPTVTASVGGATGLVLGFVWTNSQNVTLASGTQIAVINDFGTDTEDFGSSYRACFGSDVSLSWTSNNTQWVMGYIVIKEASIGPVNVKTIDGLSLH